MPDNILYLIRLQRLASIGSALPARPAAPPLSPSQLRALLKHPLISGEYIRMQEDPYEEIYVEEVAFHGGPRLVLQGLTNHSAHTARVLLHAIFGSAGQVLPRAYVREASPLISGVLSLSDAICHRAGLRRGTTTAQTRRSNPFVPGRERLAELRSVTMFTPAALDNLMSGASQQALGGWITEAGAHPVSLDGDITDNGLIVRPLLRDGPDLIVVNPGELASALRHHLIVLAASHGCRDGLADAFRRTAATQAGELLRQIGALPRDLASPTTDRLVIRQNFDAAAGTVIDLGVLSDDLSDYDPTDPFGRWDIPNAGQPLQDILDSPGPAVADDERTLRLAVTDDLARFQFIGFEEYRRPGPFLGVPLDQLQVMIDLDGDDPLFLWRFAQANERLHSASAVVQSWSTLDTYSIYRDHDHSFYLSDDRPPMMVSVAVGSGANLRADAQRKLDRHHIPGPSGNTYAEVLSVYGTDTAPIYFTHPRHETVAMAVEIPGATVWVSYTRALSQAVRGFLFTMLEAVAYWVWQLELAEPGTLARGADPTGQLRVAVTPDDSERWDQVLTGHGPDEAQDDDDSAAPSWVTASASTGHVVVTTLTDHASVLLSRTNIADRQLVRALVGALVPAGGPELADAVTERVAPVGPKRMIHITRSGDVLLVPAEVNVRTVQPAVTATILDDLGQWLREQGLATGPIEPAKRNSVLNQAVEYYYQRLAALIAGLSPDGLIPFLVSQDEALVQDHAARAQRLPSQLACFGPESVRAQDLRTQEDKNVQAAVASRYLVEYTAATPPQGNTPINLMIYDEMLALAAELIARATLSDAIKYELSHVSLSILASGRLGVSVGDQYAAGTRAAAAAEAETRHALALEPAPRVSPLASHAGTSTGHPADDSDTRTRVDDAMRAEFGFTLTQVIDGLTELAMLSVSRQSNPCSERVGDLRTRLGALPGWDQRIAQAFLDKLTLRARLAFLSPGADVYPWRFTRDLSYIRRPLVEIADPAGEPLLIWGARRTWFAARYWAELVLAGRLKGTTREMRTLLGSIRQGQNKAFEGGVEAALGTSGMPITGVAVKRIGGQRLLSAEGADLGDIDAIAVDPATKTIIVAEAKDFELARTPAELANEVDDLLVGEKSAVHKLGRRAEWVGGHLPVVLRHFGVSDSAKGWRVLAVVTTSRNLLSPYVLQTSIPVLALPDLPRWVNEQRNPQRRRRR